MIQIRKGVFETNSSSTHSICISKAPVTHLPKSVVFRAGEYGWENRRVENTASYLFTAILDGPPALRTERLARLENSLASLGIECVFRYPTWIAEYGCYENCYIDHGYELGDFIDAVLSDQDLLVRYLFGYSCIYTGNDNQDPQPGGCDIAEEFYWEYEESNDWQGRKLANPYHDKEHFEYYMKGN